MGAFDVLDCEPREIRAGDAISWRRADLAAAYPPAEFSLAYKVVPDRAASGVIDWAAAEAAGVFEVALSSAATALYLPDRYLWAALLTRLSDGARVTVDRGEVAVRADPGAVAEMTQSHTARVVAALEALIEGRVTRDVESYTIEGRQVSKIPILEAERMLGRYRAQLRRERGQSPVIFRKVNFHG